MDAPRLTDLCDRLVARLADHTLTRFELIDMATALMLVRRDLEKGIDVHDRGAIGAVSTPLGWIRDHGQDAPVDELRSHGAAAAQATVQILIHDSSHPGPASRQPSNQERAHA